MGQGPLRVVWGRLQPQVLSQLQRFAPRQWQVR
jgi:hypothetical protein